MLRLTLVPLLAAALLPARAAGPLLPVVFYPQNGVWRTQNATFDAQFDANRATFHDGARHLDLHFVNPSPSATLAPCSESQGAIHRLNGNTSTHAQAYSCLSSLSLYPGIDLRWSASGARLKSEYHLAPQADPRQIRLRFPNATPEIAPDGALLLHAPSGLWREEPPIAWQINNIPVRYEILPDSSITFSVPSYNPNLPLVIDPVITFSTTLGGSGISSATAVAADSAGFLYVAGYTDASDLPTQSPASARATGVDAFVAKVHPATGRLVYATYLGGSGDDRIFALAVDSLGSAYLAGWTTSSNFPTVTPYQAALSGSKDAFLAKLNPAGSALSFSTYYGGTLAESANAIALNSSAVYIAGESTSTNLPGVSNGFQSTLRGGADGFVARFSLTGSLLSATYLGGNGDDTLRALALDPAGHLYAAGMTASTNLTLPAGAYQSTLKGQLDGYIYKLDATLLQSLAATYLGGNSGDISSQESVNALAVDSSENVYAAGVTPSGNFPLLSAFQTTSGGQQDAFVTKLNPSLGSLAFSTFLGGAAKDSATALTLDASGKILVAGNTSSSGFPTASPLAACGGSAEAFLARLGSTGNTLSFSTCLGGSGADGANALALEPSGSVALAGQSTSLDLPQRNPSQLPTGSTARMFLTRIALGTLPTLGSFTPGASWTFSATHSGGSSQIGQLDLLITAGLPNSAACRVRYLRSTGALALADNTGLTWTTVRPGVAESAANSQCTLAGATSSVAAAGNTLTVTAALTFQSTFAGVRQVYLNAANATLEETGFDLKGTYTVAAPTNQAPTLTTVSPASGSGTGGLFTFYFADANGGADIASARMLFNTTASETNACALRYDRATGQLRLGSDDAATWSSGLPGAQTTLANSRCRLKLATSSITIGGTSLTIRLDLDFLAAMAGAKNVYMYAADTAGASAGFSTRGTWTAIAPIVPATPVPVSVTPNAGNGENQSFVFNFSDANGAADISTLRLLFNSTQTAAGGCYLWFDRSASTIWLANDAASSWSAAARLGTNETAANSQCTFRATGSSLSASGNTLTFTANMTFTAAFSGTQKIYANVTDAGSLTSDSPQLGTFTVSVAGANPLGPVSVAPSAGSGAAQVFTVQFADPKGAADLGWVRLLINSTQTGVNACFLSVDIPNRIAYLTADDGGGWTPVHLGQAETASNTQCSLRGAGSSIALSGSTATLLADLTFSGAFNGAKNIYANASQLDGTTSAAPLIGTYTVAAALPNQPPSPVSLSPSNASGGRQIFTVTYSDANGGADIADARILIHSSQRPDAGCYLVTLPQQGLYQLADDFGMNWSTAHMGTNESAQNSQCAVYAATSSFSVNGNNLVLTLDIAFKSGFLGAKSVWANSTDAAGAASASPLMGTYTVTSGIVNQQPIPVSVSPTTGSGNRQQFTFTFTDTDGGSDISYMRVLVHSVQQAGAGCYLDINRAAALAFLADDSGGTWTMTRMGTTDTAQNSQCKLYAATSSVAASGNSVTLVLDLGFFPAFAGPKSVWANVTDNSSLVSASPLLGSYTVTP